MAPGQVATTTKDHGSDHDAALIASKATATTDAARGKTWRAYLFNTPQAAANYANQTPAQGAGEVIFSVLPDGKVWVFPYF
jgi:hypothetical protein